MIRPTASAGIRSVSSTAMIAGTRGPITGPAPIQSNSVEARIESRRPLSTCPHVRVSRHQSFLGLLALRAPSFPTARRVRLSQHADARTESWKCRIRNSVRYGVRPSDAFNGGCPAYQPLAEFGLRNCLIEPDYELGSASLVRSHLMVELTGHCGTRPAMTALPDKLRASCRRNTPGIP